MNKIFNAVKIFVATIFLCGIIFICNTAAAEIRVITLEEAKEEALEIFRETVIQTAKPDNRVFHQNIIFTIPRLTGEATFFGAIEKNTLKMAGNFELLMVDANGKEDNTTSPFYVVQDKDNMVFYFQDGKKWKKMTSPTSAANMIDMFATLSFQQLETMLEFVKDVKILQESEKSRTLLVKIDGEKIFELIKSEIEKDPDFQKQQNDATMQTIIRYVETGFKNSEIWYTWTVDKINWQTTTISFNISNLLQNIAVGVLSDPSQPLNNIDELREMFETVAFYSEFKGYTTFLNDEAKSRLEIPKKVLKAKEVESFTEDDKKSKKK